MKDRCGGGLTFVMKKSLEKHVVVKLISLSTFEEFEACIMYNSVSLTLVSLHHPPQDRQNKSTNKMFLDQFPDFLHWPGDSKGRLLLWVALIFTSRMSMTAKCVN